MKKIAIITGIFAIGFVGCKTSSETSSASGNSTNTEVAKEETNNEKNPQPSETSPKKPTTMKSLRSAPRAVE